MPDKENRNALNCRVDPVLLALRKPGETNREFVERAIARLRDCKCKGSGNATMEHEILVKLIRAFIDARLDVSTITREEGSLIDKIVRDEIL